MTADDRTIIRLVYMGVRWDPKARKLRSGWLDSDGETRWYSKLQGSALGCTYEVEQDAAGTSIYPATLRFVEDVLPHEQASAWLRANTEARTLSRLDAAERAAAKDQPEGGLGAMTLEQAGRWVRGAIGTNRAARLAAVMKELGL